MSLLLLFSGAGEDEEYGKPDTGVSAYEYRNLQARLHREDNEILEIIITSVLKGN